MMYQIDGNAEVDALVEKHLRQGDKRQYTKSVDLALELYDDWLKAGFGVGLDLDGHSGIIATIGGGKGVVIAKDPALAICLVCLKARGVDVDRWDERFAD